MQHNASPYEDALTEIPKIRKSCQLRWGPQEREKERKLLDWVNSPIYKEIIQRQDDPVQQVLIEK